MKRALLVLLCATVGLTRSGASQLPADKDIARLESRHSEKPDDLNRLLDLINAYYERRLLGHAAEALSDAEVLIDRAPPPRASASKLKRGGVDVPAPLRTVHVAPVYPREALAARKQGTVLLDLEIDATGKVTAVDVVEPVRWLDVAAVRAARQWRFEPTIVDGVARRPFAANPSGHRTS